MRRLLLLLLFPLLLSSLFTPVAHAASVCGETVTNKLVVNNSVTIADIDQNDSLSCALGKPLLEGNTVTQGAVYHVDMDLQNMAGSTPADFDAWIGFRRTDQDNKYSLHFLATTVEFRVLVAGKHTTLGSAPYTTPLSSFAHLRLSENGFTFTLLDRDTGQTILQASDPQQTFASGPTLTFYAQPDTVVCWDNVAGSPN